MGRLGLAVRAATCLLLLAIGVLLGGCQEAAYYRTCDQAREAGAAPMKKGEPGYRSALDRNGDGIACEED